MALSEEKYEAFLAALGRLCIHWAMVDLEINALLAIMLDVEDDQVACISTEMNDVAPRCRLIKRLAYTIPAPTSWREALSEVCNIIANDIGPKRNRYIHDLWFQSESSMTKIDRRAKIITPQSFQESKLVHGIVEEVGQDNVDHVSVMAIVASATLAEARFDLDALRTSKRFPDKPLLSLERFRRIVPTEPPPHITVLRPLPRA